MHQSIRHFKTLIEICAAILAVLLLIGSLGVFYAFWHLSKGPVDISWAEPYVQRALGGDKEGVDVKVKGMVAEWKSLDSPLTLGVADLSVVQGGGEVFSVSQVGIQVDKAPLLLGIVSLESIFIQSPVIRLEKSTDGKISFLIANNEAAPETERTPMSSQELGDSLFLGGLLSDTSRLPLSKLRAFVIKDATISIDDKAQNKVFNLPSADVTVQREENDVNMVLSYSGGDGHESKINAVITRKNFRDSIQFTLNMDDIDAGLWALNLPSLPGLMKESYIFDGSLTGHFDLEWNLQSIDGKITTSQGGKIQQSFDISGNRNPQTGIIPVELQLPEIGIDQIASVWPEGMEDLGVTVWFTEKLSKGIIKNLSVVLPFKNENGKWSMAGDVSGEFDYENLTCDYRAPLYPLSEGYGRATIKDNTLTILVDRAKLKDMDVSNGSVIISHLVSDHAGQAEVKLNLKGPLKTAFDYIALEPISLGEKLKMDRSKVEGKGDINVTVTFPTIADLPADQVVANVDATLTDTKLPGIVKGMDLSGGPLKLKVEKGAFDISGNGALQGTPMEFSYSEYLNTENAPYAASVKAKLVTDDAMRRKFGIDLSEYVSGKAAIDLNYVEKTNGTTDIDIKADLTQGQTFVKPLNYIKKEGVAGNATAKLHLKGDTIQKVSDLNVTIGPDHAKSGQLIFGMLGKENNVISASFEKIKLGENDLKLRIEQTVSVMKVIAEGASLDARAFLGKSDAGEKRSRDVDVNVKAGSMRMGDGAEQVLKNVTMQTLVNPAGEVKRLDLKSKAGNGDFSINLSPSSKGVMNLRMDSNDAGAALKSIGAYSNMVGGNLSLSGAQMQGGKINDIQGAAVIENFKVVKAPALAKLIGAFSITGLPELLANDGISFSKLKSNFIWRQTKRGDRIINLYDGATSGGSVGLTFGGVINQTKDTLDLSGTFVPISQINKVVSSIPIVGQLLTGGKNGGIIAATYSLKGPSSDPKVMVNPLSVLAPGFLRSILFEGGLNSGRDEKPIVPRNRKTAPAKPAGNN
ncbi:MAG: hypothetical protein DI586_04505 [Micavibrio aeruginosavorus]|uniref:YhdP central domain-containing protein n=1 Tax=Micavibrio aeruginosavorus TaxID=349221 RepID=A0A2W5FJT6_9BACT|nr:MAG: hypothetical protein DI586_04505 [Micavibrio aeruginosavorus]